MSIVFASAASHAPGMTAWAEAASPQQREALFGAYGRLRDELAESRAEVLVLLTSEHWANFFLDHISAFCVGRGEAFRGPVEPWLKVPPRRVTGDPDLANQIITALYDDGFEPSYSEEMVFDHGTMVPLHFLDPEGKCAVVPIMFNTLSTPQPSAARALAFGKALGAVARASDKRIAIAATGGLSHDPGERGHGIILNDFDHRFLEQMASGDMKALASYSRADFAAAGAGAYELLAWIALAGATQGAQGEVLAYEAVEAWATGIGLVSFAKTLAAAPVAA